MHLTGIRATKLLFAHGIDLAIVLLAVGIAWKVWQPSHNDEPPVELRQAVQPGMPLQVPDVDWSGVSRHVVLVLDAECPVCNDPSSVALYRQLTARVKGNPDIRLVVLAPQSAADTQSWLGTKAIEVPTVVSVPRLGAAGFLVTPTLLMVDNQGVVQDVLEGAVGATERAALFRRLDEPTAPVVSNGSATARIDGPQADAILSRGEGVLLDVRARSEYASGHDPRAINIPYDELGTRAYAEIGRDKLVVIDCREAVLSACLSARSAVDDVQSQPSRLLVR